MNADEARALALALPEAVEADHHGRPSFRVRGRIFATLWTPEALNVMASEPQIRAACDDEPETCTPVLWGRRLAAVRVDLTRADAPLVASLLDEAWRGKAPRTLRES
jgi:hypothetical protein